jgi:hypothetical protein
MCVCQRTSKYISGGEMKQIAIASRPEVFCLRSTAKESKREPYVVSSTTFKLTERETFSENLEKKEPMKL